MNQLNLKLERKLMKLNKTTIWYLIILIIAAALYRVSPLRTFGFAPHLTLALFGGAVVKDRKWAFALPLFSLFLSDLFYQFLFINGWSSIQGFYNGQWINYLEIASVVLIGFLMKKVTVTNIVVFSLIAPTWFFLISNFTVWLGARNIDQTWAGLMKTYVDGLPFYRASIMGSLLFSTIIFGAWYLWVKEKQTAKA